MENTFDIPVLMVTFNRPAYALQVFEKIKELKPKKLFIFSDGPRESKLGEDKLVDECRAIFDPINFTWDCDVQKYNAPANLGCGIGISTAINWAFESVEKLIIVEDDCVANLSFFNYCKSMLNKYENDEKVMHVAGTRWNDEFDTGNADYFFSRIGHVWGWATWKRAWALYDYKMKSWNKTNDRKMIRRLLKERIITQYWVDCFVDMDKNNPIRNHTWDYQWQYTMFKYGGMAVVPNVNLITNIGLEGVHAKESDVDKSSFNRTTKNWADNNSEKIKPIVNIEFDKYHIKNYFMRNVDLKGNIKFLIKSFI